MEKNAENYIKKWERRKELEIVTGIIIKEHDSLDKILDCPISMISKYLNIVIMREQ